MSCVGYCRVSTERQADADRTSIADQQTAIRALAARLNLEVGRWFLDEGASGASADRPAFNELFAFCEAHSDGGTILILNDSRFGRFEDPDEAAALRFRLKCAGWSVRFCESDESQDPTARTVMRAIGSAQASEYIRNLKANVRRGMRGSVHNGLWTRKAPFGYCRMVKGSGRILREAYEFPPVLNKRGKWVREGERKAGNERLTLVPNDEEAALVRWMFEAYDQGADSLGTLADKLKERAPSRKWSRSGVSHVLRNEVYLGRVRYRGTHELGPLDTDDAHPAIVSSDLFKRVGARLAENQRRCTRADEQHYLLSRVLRCAKCGGLFVGGGHSLRRGRRDFFYREQHPCKETGLRGTAMRHVVEPAVIDEVGKALKTRAVQELIATEIDRALAGKLDTGKVTKLLAARERKARDAEDRISTLAVDGVLTPAKAAEQMRRVRAELAEIERERAELKQSSQRRAALKGERDRLLAVATDFAGIAARLEGTKLRKELLPWLRQVTYEKQGYARAELTLHLNPLPGVVLLSNPLEPTRARQRDGRWSRVSRRAEAAQPPTRQCDVRRRSAFQGHPTRPGPPPTPQFRATTPRPGRCPVGQRDNSHCHLLQPRRRLPGIHATLEPRRSLERYDWQNGLRTCDR
jgi:DNA invertase Pin-like site-specific DNA recombinase